jgi:uncharacterized coiled-coil DUF342 family protein
MQPQAGAENLSLDEISFARDRGPGPNIDYTEPAPPVNEQHGRAFFNNRISETSRHFQSQLKRRIKMSAKRDAYVEKLKAQLDEWNADIDKLAAKAAQAEAEAKIEYQNEVEDLRAKRDDVRDKLSAIRQAGEGAWEDLKEGLENSWEILKMSFTKAKSEFEKGYKKGGKD